MLSKQWAPVILVLAAGQSRRFEGIKVIEPVTDKPMLLDTLAQLPEAKTFVATGNYHERIQVLCEHHGVSDQVSFLPCKTAINGLGFTISEAVATIQQRDVSHIMIALCDQVALTKSDFSALLKTSKQSPEQLVCSEFDGQPSVPAIFPRSYFSALMSLSGDKGAKSILKQNQHNLISLKLERASVDIDTRQELQAWQQRLTKQPLSETT